jgi:hypothetical protein
MLRVPRLTFAAFGILTASSSFDAAQADPYRWCADYTALGGIGARNCYFITLAQCRATISGVGGMCVENPFYDGIGATDSRPARRIKPRT